MDHRQLVEAVGKHESVIQRQADMLKAYAERSAEQTQTILRLREEIGRQDVFIETLNQRVMALEEG